MTRVALHSVRADVLLFVLGGFADAPPVRTHVSPKGRVMALRPEIAELLHLYETQPDLTVSQIAKRVGMKRAIAAVHVCRYANLGLVTRRPRSVPKTTRIIELFNSTELSYSSIADAVGVNIGFVCAALHRARKEGRVGYRDERKAARRRIDATLPA